MPARTDLGSQRPFGVKIPPLEGGPVFWTHTAYRKSIRSIHRPLIYSDTQQAKSEISDHLPVWDEFRIDGADDD